QAMVAGRWSNPCRHVVWRTDLDHVDFDHWKPERFRRAGVRRPQSWWPSTPRLGLSTMCGLRDRRHSQMSNTQPSTTFLPSLSQEDLPYVNAVRAYASKEFLRLPVPGHTGSAATQPELADMFGESVLALDVPPLVDGIDQGPVP